MANARLARPAACGQRARGRATKRPPCLRLRGRPRGARAARGMHGSRGAQTPRCSCGGAQRKTRAPPPRPPSTPAPPRPAPDVREGGEMRERGREKKQKNPRTASTVHPTSPAASKETQQIWEAQPRRRKRGCGRCGPRAAPSALGLFSGAGGEHRQVAGGSGKGRIVGSPKFVSAARRGSLGLRSRLCFSVRPCRAGRRRASRAPRRDLNFLAPRARAGAEGGERRRPAARGAERQPSLVAACHGRSPRDLCRRHPAVSEDFRGSELASRLPGSMACRLTLRAFLILALGLLRADASPDSSWWNLVPRKTVPYSDVKEVTKRFSKAGVSNYTTLTLADPKGLLYVGAREAIFALRTSNMQLEETILWEAPEEKKAECIQKGKSNQTDCFNYIRFLQTYNSSHMYTCGTYAFQPKCAYIDLDTFSLDKLSFEDGRGKCPYDPAKGHTGLIVEEELYSATLYNFLGTEPVILRNLGPQYSVKTEHLPTWLNEPHFVGSAFVQESKDSKKGDDDKVYFFFSERAVEYDCDIDQVVARVARVCKGDVGGARTLQKRWTTFLKARLLCSIPEQQLHFNRIQGTYTLAGDEWTETSFFGVFQARWGDVDVSAVCQYQIQDVQKVFEGPYKEYSEIAQKWVPYSDQVPNPRPGACITNSLELPDNTLNFAKKHPLMDKVVLPHSDRPLLVKKDANFTQLVVERVHGLDGNPYELLYIGTDHGWLYKAVVLPSGVHLIEELQIFEQAEPIKSIVLSQQKRVLFVGSNSHVIQLPVADCSKYLSCSDCILAKDPYCAWTWNGSRCVRIDAYDGTSMLFQDLGLEPGMCSIGRTVRPGTKVTAKNITVMVGTDLVLPCRLTSNLAKAHWIFNGQELPEEQATVLYDVHLQALIILEANMKHSGMYRCVQLEERNELKSETYMVTVVSETAMSRQAQAPLESFGLVWTLVIALGAACLVLLLVVLSLRRRLREELEKGSKTIESTLVYPIELPKEPKSPTFIPSTTSDSDEKLWDPASYYYSDGSLKIVPGHAVCQNGGTTPSPTANGIPGQPLQSPPLHSPNRINLGNIRGSSSNGYIRLNLGTEERPDYSDLAEELRRKLKQRQALPDSNPEESSV
uniref:Semaphorin 4C n=1 Tax=Salvator merianae TaxID=96440 RepID=A0A8D0E4D3_SALMN